MSDASLQRIHVLHVDDEPALTDLTASFLERNDERFDVETASSADEGLTLIPDMAPDCVVSDYDMPGMDGIEFLEAVREAHPDLPFILYTGKGSEKVASDAISAGVTDYLQKGSGAEQYELLANRIRNAVQARHDAERAARQEELMRLTEFAGDTGGWELDLETGEVLLTDGARRLLDVPDDAELSMADAIEMYHPDDREALREALDRAAETGTETHGTWRLQVADDDQRLVALTITPVSGAGETSTLRGSIHDITQRTQRQRELKAERRFTQQALDALDDLFYLFDVDGTLQRWNKRASEVTGYSDSELAGKPALELFPEDEHAKISEAMATVYTGEQVTVEATLLTADGERRPYEFTGSRLTDADGNAIGLAGVARDLTDRRQRERRFQALVEQSNDIISIVDAEGQFQYQSPSLERILGYSPEETIGDYAWEYIHPQDRESVRATFEEWLTDPETMSVIEYRAEDAAGNWHWMEARGNNQIDNPAVEGYVVNSRDITDKVEDRHALERQQERLTAVARIVRHDLRTLLETAREHLPVAQEADANPRLTAARDAITRSERLVDDLLTLARDGAQVEETEPVDLTEIAEETWQAVETERASLRTTGDRTLDADPDHVRKLLANLFRNAVEHGGPEVTVTVGSTGRGFYVADTGPGIPPGADVFEEGHSTSGDGAGFGLRIVEQMAAAHGWAVHVSERSDGGARFDIVEDEGARDG